MLSLGTWSADQFSSLSQTLRWPLTVLYLAVIALVCLYGLHRYWLVILYYRTRRRVPRPKTRFENLPRVTVQLPMYNERLVAERIIEAACRIEYPHDKLQIQVLDDSTDESAEIARLCVERMKAQGFDIEYIHRNNRLGFKAGALNEGLKTVTGELIAIFDADFVPPTNILKRTVHHFTDPTVGMVQTCWDHLNRESSLLTRTQAILLDGHFLIEHTARNRSGRWMNFNGTAGVWRRTAIDSAGGWQHDTLTEDVDLSYRAQLKGWRFLFLQRARCPAELPPEINAFKSQQHRWTKGSIQSARKLLPTIMRSNAPLRAKIEAFFHLTSPIVYVLVVAMTLLFFPAFFVNMSPIRRGSALGWVFGFSLFAMACASAGTFYVVSQRERHRSSWRTVLHLPMLMALGIGISLNNARAVIEALLGRQSDFVRTPKYNVTGSNTNWRAHHGSIRLPTKVAMPVLELLMAVYLTGCSGVMVFDSGNSVVSLPFLVLFAFGYWYVGLNSFLSLVHRPSPKLLGPAPAV